MYTVVVEYYNEYEDIHTIPNVLDFDASDDRYFCFDKTDETVLIRHSTIKRINAIKEKE